MRPDRDAWAMGMAIITAQRRTCVRRAVGCVLLNFRGHVLATGYNGVASGQPHCSEGCPCSGAFSPSGTNLDGCNAIHAEQNALLQCTNVWEIHTAYTTTAPCITCCKLLLNTSCQRIVYLEDYVQPESKTLWLSAGREWSKLEFPSVFGEIVHASH